MNRFYFIFILIFVSVQAFAQQIRIKFEHISLEEGLSQSSVPSVLRDSRGFMWFATIDGLNKYDGYKNKVYYNNIFEAGSISDNVLNVLYEATDEKGSTFWVGTAANGLCRYNKYNDNFETYRNDPQNKNSLSNNAVTAVAGNNTVLWVGTENGLNKFFIEKGNWQVYNNLDKNSISGNFITSLLTAPNNNLWIGTKNGLNYLDVNRNTFTVITEKDGLPSNIINFLYIDSKNNLWVATPKGIALINLYFKIETIFKAGESNKSLNDNYVTSIVEDNEGIFWIGTRKGGLNRYDPQTKTFKYFMHDPSEPNSLSTNNILTIYQDKSKILWIGTSLGGINKWNRAADDLALFRHNPYNSYSLSSNQVRSVYQAKNGTIWIGTVEGGLNKWQTSENKFIHYSNNPKDPASLSNNHVRTIFEDSRNNFWVGTSGGGLNLFDTLRGKFKHFVNDPQNRFSLSHDNIWKILQDKAGTLWIATHGGGLNWFDYETQKFYAYRNDPTDNNSISTDQLTTLLEDRDGNLWIGSFKGLNKFNSKTKTFTRYIFSETDSTTISNNRVYAIIEDKDGIIWVATKGGLNKFDKVKGTFKRYTSYTTDFPNNVMTGILEDDLGNLWISSNRGISKFNKKTEKIRNYDIRDGLQSNEFLAGSFCKTKSGEFIFGGINGFNAFFPEKIRDNQNIPSLAFTGFRVSNTELHLDTNITEKKIIHLNHRQTDITIDFVALDFIFPEKNQYAYKLEGYDKNWNYVKFERTAKYTNLPPKKYIFRIKGSNNDEVWNEEGTQLVIEIEPAIWQTLWFKISGSILVILLIGAIVWARIEMLHRQKKHLEHMVTLRTAEVVKQKEEIEAQRDEIEKQRDIAERQRDEISHQKKEITDSIRYAQRIQTAALPSPDFLTANLPEHFILFKPRDIVSGDFFWAGKKNNRTVVIAADCTGHGVPGAFMSMLGISFLNKIVNEDNVTEPDEILNHLRSNVIHALHQKGIVNEAKDGMDITVCTIDHDRKVVIFSGANNPLYIVRNQQDIVYKADNMPIAIYDKMDSFAKHEIEYQSGDCFYLFSDGYADQFGGPNGKKFMYKKFRELLAEISVKPMDEQKEILDNNIEKWKQYPTPEGQDHFEQIDDIVVFGFRV